MAHLRYRRGFAGILAAVFVFSHVASRSHSTPCQSKVALHDVQIGVERQLRIGVRVERCQRWRVESKYHVGMLFDPSATHLRSAQAGNLCWGNPPIGSHDGEAGRNLACGRGSHALQMVCGIIGIGFPRITQLPDFILAEYLEQAMTPACLAGNQHEVMVVLNLPSAVAGKKVVGWAANEGLVELVFAIGIQL